MQETKTNEFNKIFDTSRKNLLDMGLRNNLLNFKEVKRTIPIIDEDIGELYNILIISMLKQDDLLLKTCTCFREKS